MEDITCIYYTSNQEDPKFEKKIQENILKQTDLPIISVSQKPIDFGNNICIGEKPVSYTTEWKQLLIGLRAARTKFCIAIEADCLYPIEYFKFTPQEDDMVYNYDNVYIVWKYKDSFYKKGGYCEGAQICGREYWIKRLESLLPEGWVTQTKEQERNLIKMIFLERKEFTGRPVISFKTRDGVSCRTIFVNNKIKELPYWGGVDEVKKQYLWK